MVAPPTTIATAAVPSGMAADCSVDVAAQLRNWIASVPDGSTLGFGTNACYRVESAISVVGRHNLVFEGNGATLRAFTLGVGNFAQVQNRQVMYFVDGGGFTVRNLNVRGAGTSHGYDTRYEGQAGFQFTSVQGALLDHVSAYETAGDFVQIDSYDQGAEMWSSDITVQNSTFTWAGRQGVSVSGGQHIVLRNNTLTGFAQDAIDLETEKATRGRVNGVPTGGGCDDVHIVANTFRAPLGQIFMGATAVDGGRMSNIEVRGNTTDAVNLQMMVYATAGVHMTNVTVADNTNINSTWGSPRGLFEFQYVDGVTVTNNTQGFETYPTDAVRVWGASNGSVTNNRFPGTRAVLVVDGPGAPDANGTGWSGPRSVNCRESGKTT